MKKLLPVFLAILLATGCAGATPPGAGGPASSDPRENIKALGKLAGLPDLPIQFVGMAAMANSPSGDMQVGLYKDSAGRKFSVDPDSGLVLEIDAREVTEGPTSAAMLSEPELKSKAENLAREATPGFDGLQDGLTYFTGSKDDTYFYTWQTTDPGQYFMPPFIQVALNTHGDLVGYVNTVILPE